MEPAGLSKNGVRKCLACYFVNCMDVAYWNFAECMRTSDKNARVSNNSKPGREMRNRFDAVMSFVNSSLETLMAAVLSEVEELGEAVQAAATLQEVMRHQLGCTSSRFDIDAQTD